MKNIMKPISAQTEEESKRIFWVIQTIFGFIIARSFYIYGQAFIPPLRTDVLTLSLGLISVYSCVLWSWVDYSFTTIIAPYQFRVNKLEKFRFLTDLLIVLVYSYLLLYLDYISKNPEGNIIPFFITFIVVFVGYIISGILRIIQYGRRASRVKLLLFFSFLFLALALYYNNQISENNLVLNRISIGITILLTIVYRLVRSLLKKRKYTIAVDVDGVLANQIDGVLPIIKNEFNIKLDYDDVTDWKLPIKNTSIDKIIVAEQNQRSYILQMPVHPGASGAISELSKNHYIAIATARQPRTDYWTQEWLGLQKISFDSYYNLKEGSKQNANENFDILVDDYIGNIEAYLQKGEGKAILFSQPWNQKRDSLKEFIEDGRLKIANDWSTIPNQIKELLK